MSAAKHTPGRESASTRIDRLMPSVCGRSDAEMGNRAGFREARDAAAQIASEHDVIASELIEALETIERITRSKGLTDAERKTAVRDIGETARAAIAKATGSAA